MLANNKIINLADPENNGDAVSKNYVNTVIQKYQLKPSHHDNQFAYLMRNTLEWSNLTPVFLFLIFDCILFYLFIYFYPF